MESTEWGPDSPKGPFSIEWPFDHYFSPNQGQKVAFSHNFLLFSRSIFYPVLFCLRICLSDHHCHCIRGGINGKLVAIGQRKLPFTQMLFLRTSIHNPQRLRLIVLRWRVSCHPNFYAFLIFFYTLYPKKWVFKLILKDLLSSWWIGLLDKSVNFWTESGHEKWGCFW